MKKSFLMGALPARVTLVPLRSFWDRINHKSGHGVPDFEISARTKVKLLECVKYLFSWVPYLHG